MFLSYSSEWLTLCVRARSLVHFECFNLPSVGVTATRTSAGGKRKKVAASGPRSGPTGLHVLTRDPWPQRDCGIGVGENLRWSGGGWGGFSRLTGAKTTVRSSTWRPSAPGWSMTEVSQDLDPRRFHWSGSLTALCLVSFVYPLLVCVLVEQGRGFSHTWQTTKLRPDSNI